MMDVVLLKRDGCKVEEWQDIQNLFVSCVNVAVRS